jgi:hypothetical protein
MALGKNVQILRCCNHASVDILAPTGFWLKTARLQLPWIEPSGPKSCTDTTTVPTIHSTKSMNAPIMTMAGNRRWLKTSQRMMKMYVTSSAPTVMK